MKDNEETILVCIRVQDANGHVPGSVIKNCSKCGQLVHVSPTSQEILEKKPETQVRCNQCIDIKEMLKTGTVETLTSKQAKEILDTFKKDEEI